MTKIAVEESPDTVQVLATCDAVAAGGAESITVAVSAVTVMLLADEAPAEVKIELSGPPGPAGPPGVREAASYIAAMPISALRVVQIEGDGQIRYASDADALSAFRVLGVSSSAAVAGDVVRVHLAGEFTDPDLNLTPGEPVFLGLDGALVQPPRVGSIFVLQIGSAISLTSLIVDLQPPVYRSF